MDLLWKKIKNWFVPLQKMFLMFCVHIYNWIIDTLQCYFVEVILGVFSSLVQSCCIQFKCIWKTYEKWNEKLKFIFYLPNYENITPKRSILNEKWTLQFRVTIQIFMVMNFFLLVKLKSTFTTSGNLILKALDT
jgi:hypothetical protein